MKNQKSTSQLKKHCLIRCIYQTEKYQEFEGMNTKKLHKDKKRKKTLRFQKKPLLDQTTTGLIANLSDIPTVCKNIPIGMFQTINAILNR